MTFYEVRLVIRDLLDSRAVLALMALAAAFLLGFHTGVWYVLRSLSEALR